MVLAIKTGQTAKPYPIVAPVGGLNGRDSLGAMPPQDAYTLDNWFPGTASVDSRNGFVPHVAPVGAPVEGLVAYTGGATAKMLAFTGGRVLDVSARLAAPVEVRTGRVSNHPQSAMFSNAGNQFLVTVEDGNTPFSYDGTAATTLAISGVKNGQMSLADVLAFKGRLYFAATGELGFYYLPVGNIQGAASYYDLAQVAKNGGYLAALASFTADGGDGTGPQDYALFITSQGEYIAYAGYDPTNADNWSLVARWYAAPVIGRNCVLNYNSDLQFITTEGLISLSEIRRSSGVEADRTSLSAKLGKYLSSLNQFKDTHGWQALLHSTGSMLVLNAPINSTTAGGYVQFAMNTVTKAWSRFTGMNGICWLTFNQKLYFGAFDGGVYEADSGPSDNGVPIRLESKQAYNSFDDGYGATNKHFHFAKLLIATTSRPPISISFNTDFRDEEPQFIGTPNLDDESQWDTAVWDQSFWGDEYGTQTFLVSVGKIGIAGSLWFRATVDDTKLQWFATQYMFSKVRGLF